MADLRSEVESRAQNLLGEQQRLSGLQADLPSMADKLRDALQSRMEHPLMGQRAEAIQQFFEAGPKARMEGQQLLGGPGAPARPTAVENLVAQRRASALTPVTGLTGLIGAKLGGIEDVIQRGVGAFQSLVGAQQGRVGLEQTGYELALRQLVEQEGKRQWEFEQELKAKQLTGGKITLPNGEVIDIPRPEGKKKTAGEKKQEYVNDLIDDVRRGANLDEAMSVYSPHLTPQEILDQYRLNSPYGPPGESEWDLWNRYGIIPPPESRTPLPPEEGSGGIRG